jgi:drug/metabolite transporter (DMT)-like permease
VRSWGSLVRFVVLALVWGSSFLWIKVALGVLTPVQITVARLGLGTLVLLGLCLVTRTRLPRDRRFWLRMVVPAVLGNALPFTLFGLAEQRVDSGVAGVLNATTALWVLVISLLVGAERRPGALRVTGLLLGFAGTVVIFAPWQASGFDGWGVLACLAATLSYGASYTYIGRHLSGRTSPMVLSASQLGLATLVGVAALPLTGGLRAVHLAAGPAVGVAVLGVLGTGLAFLVNNRLIADEGATTAASVGYLVPVVSVLLGAVALHEPLSARVLAGTAVVLAGVALSRRRPARAPEVPLAQTSLRSVAQRDSS